MILRLLFILGLAAMTPGIAAPFAALAKMGPLSAEFTETRHTPLKKRPVVVTGIVRVDRARGLSLAYAQPRSPVVILDEKGLLLRHADGREQSAPPDAEEDIRLLHALFAFDFATLEKSYERQTTENPDGTWTLTFTRRPESSASYRELVITGTADHLTAITLAKTANLRTDIVLGYTEFNRTFTPEDLARYFR